jgi:hypothetical protein
MSTSVFHLRCKTLTPVQRRPGSEPQTVTLTTNFNKIIDQYYNQKLITIMGVSDSMERGLSAAVLLPTQHANALPAAVVSRNLMTRRRRTFRAVELALCPFLIRFIPFSGQESTLYSTRNN